MIDEMNTIKPAEITEEVWRPVKDFTDYEVSNLGNVRRVLSNGNTRMKQPYIRDGARCVQIYHKKHGVTKRIARLVAEAFIPNPNGLPIAYHKSGNMLDDCYTNIGWGNRCDPKHGITKFAAIAAVRNGKVMYVYKTITDAARSHKIGTSSVARALSGTQTAGGYKWIYLLIEPSAISRYNNLDVFGLKCARCSKIKSISEFAIREPLAHEVIQPLPVCAECKAKESKLRALCKKYLHSRLCYYEAAAVYDLYEELKYHNTLINEWTIEGHKIESVINNIIFGGVDNE